MGGSIYTEAEEVPTQEELPEDEAAVEDTESE